MTHNKKLTDLFYFKGKIDNTHITINLTENIEIKDNLKVIVINPPSDEHQEELLKEITEFIQDKYYS